MIHWKWSSYQLTAYGGSGLPWLHAKWILDQFNPNSEQAKREYRKYIAEGTDKPCPWEKLRGQIYLGSDKFIKEMALRIKNYPSEQISKAAIQPDRPYPDHILREIADLVNIRSEEVLERKVRKDVFQVTVYLLRRACNLPVKEVAELAKVSASRISQIQRSIEDAGGLGSAFKWAAILEKYIKAK